MLLHAWYKFTASVQIASLALAALAAPEALSYASIAGMSGANGLYAAYTAPIAYSLFGSSPQLVTGPTTLMSVLTLDAMGATGTWGGKTLKPESPLYTQVAHFLALVVGLQQVVLALVGGASLTSLLSAPIISGFTTGSALIIGASQLYKIFGVPKCELPDGDLNSCTIQAAVWNVADHFPGMRWQTPVLSLVSILFLLLWKNVLPRYLPRSLRIVGNMAPLLLLVCTGEVWVRVWTAARCVCGQVFLASAGAVTLVSTAQRVYPCLPRTPPSAGSASYCMQKEFADAGIVLAKSLPSGVPGPQWPTMPPGTTSEDVLRLFGSAVQCSIIGYIGALSIGRVVGREFGYAIDESRE